MALAATAAIAALTPAVADASVSITKFSLTPSTTKAGSDPDLTVDASFGNSLGDDPKSFTVSLAPGLLANPTVAGACSSSQLSNNSCPADSKLGTGHVYATVLGQSQDWSTSLYLTQPKSGELGRVGATIYTQFGDLSWQGDISIRKSPTVGADITFSDLPTQVLSFPVSVTGVDLTLNGTIGGKPFTRNPTSCATATTTLQTTAVLWPNGTSTASSSFTPTGCSALTFAPQLSASASIGGAAGNVGFDTTITQAATDAAIKSAKVTMPGGLYVNPVALAHACTSSDPLNCSSSSSVGTASLTTPLWSKPLTGNLVLMASGHVAAVIGSPFDIALTGTASVNSSGNGSVTFDSMPDVPLSKVQIDLAGGTGSLLIGGYDWCFGPQTVTADFTGQNGATHDDSLQLPFGGCPAAPSLPSL